MVRVQRCAAILEAAEVRGYILQFEATVRVSDYGDSERDGRPNLGSLALTVLNANSPLRGYCSLRKH